METTLKVGRAMDTVLKTRKKGNVKKEKQFLKSISISLFFISHLINITNTLITI